MGKALSDMSLAELWELFPIVLTPHQDCWALWYAEERDALLRLAAGSFPLRVHHIGSTAVRGIWAKPIVDILVDCLNSRPDVARAYEKLKLSLWKTYEHDRDGYTRAKTDFIRAWTPPAPKA